MSSTGIGPPRCGSSRPTGRRADGPDAARRGERGHGAGRPHSRAAAWRARPAPPRTAATPGSSASRATMWPASGSATTTPGRCATSRGAACRRRYAGQGPDPPLHRPDVERQPAARGRAGRLGRDRPGAAHRVAALAGPTRHSLCAAVELNANLWRSAVESGTRPASAGGALGGAGASRPRGGDKRFAAPEWHTNPVYRTLKEVYLLASDWLLKQARRGGRHWTRPSGSASTSTFVSSWTR